MCKDKNYMYSDLFIRNSKRNNGKFDFPFIKKDIIDLSKVNLLSFSDTKNNENKKYFGYGVHFFIDDYRFNSVYNNPYKSLDKLKQYAFVLTPDYSTYSVMDKWRQIESVAHSRWIGSFWQDNGIKVIPTVSWSDESSFEYAFDGIEKGSVVAVSTIGCLKNKSSFIRGYRAMIDKINPEAIICFGKPFDEMISNNLIVVDYMNSRKKVR